MTHLNVSVFFHLQAKIFPLLGDCSDVPFSGERCEQGINLKFFVLFNMNSIYLIGLFFVENLINNIV